MTEMMTRQTAVVSAPKAGDALPFPPLREQKERRRYPLRRWFITTVALLFGVVLALMAYDSVVTGLMHDQRQRHLAADLEHGRPRIGNSQAFGVIQIPTLGVNQAIIEGVTTSNLRSGPAITATSVLPGQRGSIVLFGHRSAYGGPFEGLPGLKQGAKIYLQARNKSPVVEYTVNGVFRRADPASSAPGFPPAAVGTSLLVLVTSEQGWLDDSQIVVTATASASVAGGSTSGTALSLPSGSGGSVVSFDLLLANLAIGSAAVAWRLMKTRGKSPLALLIVTPMLAVAFVRLASFLDALLPLTR